MDIEKRLSGYTTSYIDNTEVKFLSELCSDYSLAELIIFDRLKSSRIKQNREFFRGDLQEFIKEIEDVVKKVNDKSITAREKQQKKRHAQPTQRFTENTVIGICTGDSKYAWFYEFQRYVINQT
jgi:hypothetical protein